MSLQTFCNYYEDALEQLDDSLFGTLRALDLARRRVGFGGSHSVVTYPPLTCIQNTQNRSENLNHILDDWPTQPIDLYLHFPFCEYSCTYCHYDIIRGRKREEEYCDKLLETLDGWIHKITESGGDFTLGSLYLGGGTALYLSYDMLAKVADRIFNNAKIKISSDHFSFCVETTPIAILNENGTEKLEMLHKKGLNRVSIGVQTLNEGLLKKSGRTTQYSDTGDNITSQAIKMVRQAAKGVNINVDLMQDIEYRDDKIYIEAAFHDLAWVCQNLNDEDSLTYYTTRLHPGSKDFRAFIESDTLPNYEKSSMALRMSAIRYLRQNNFTPSPGQRFYKGTTAVDPFKKSRSTQKSCLLGIGCSAYSRIDRHFFIGRTGAAKWVELPLEERMMDRHHFIKSEEIHEGNIISLIRSRFSEEMWALILREHCSADYIHNANICLDQLIEYKLVQAVETDTSIFYELTDLGLSVEEEICWKLYGIRYKTDAIKYYTDHGVLRHNL